MVPTNATAVADNRLMRSNEARRRRRVSTPKLRARSSPIRSKVIAGAARSENGSSTASTRASRPSLCQSARARLPKVQNTSCCSTSSVASNCSSDTSALQLNTKAMPNSTRLCTPAPRRRDIICSSTTDRQAKANAITVTWALGASQATPSG
ncbi:hypothetical protein D3C79_735350 [compost metagenome]